MNCAKERRSWRDFRDGRDAGTLSKTRQGGRLRCKTGQRETTSKGLDIQVVMLKAQTY